jgi:hypothetical protein
MIARCGLAVASGRRGSDAVDHFPSARSEPLAVPAAVRKDLRCPDRSLEAPVRASAESRFGRDFSRVPVHDSSPAARAGPVHGLPLGVTFPTGIRALDPAETAILTPVFGSSLAYGDIQLSDAVGAGGRPYTVWNPGRGQLINIGPSAYKAPGSNPGLLVHETAHCWQSQHHPSPAAFMGNSVASQAAAAATGGDSYCYVPGKAFGDYGAEQVANQVEKGVAAIVGHVKGVSAGSWDLENIRGLSIPRWETPGAPGVVC